MSLKNRYQSSAPGKLWELHLRIVLSLAVVCILFLLSGCAPLLQNTHPLLPDLTPAKPLNSGLNRLTCADGQIVMMYVPDCPERTNEQKKVLAIIHGFKRKRSPAATLDSVISKMRQWYDFADTNNYVLIGPLFERGRFSNYQRLNLFGKRADIRLNMVLDEIGETRPDIDTRTISMFGFSGGGSSS